MNRIKTILILLTLLILPISSLSAALGETETKSDTTVQTRSTAKWSVFVYVDGDNNLEKFAIEDVNEMETVGSTPEMNLVIQIDRVNGYDKSNGDWKDTRRYLIKEDNDTAIINSERLDNTDELPLLGEKNMADPKTLGDFLEWGITEFPAEHYLVVMWDHGRGIFRSGGGSPGLFRGFNEDLTSNTQEMKLWELDDVMLKLKKLNGGRNIDIVGFDQCWLGNLETAYELKDSTDFLIASADEEPDKGYNYQPPLSALKENPDMSPAEFARRITEDYIEEYKNKSSYAYMTQATIDLNELNKTFVPLMNDFSDILKKDFYEYQELLFDIRRGLDDYYHPHPDLYHFINLIAANSSLSPELRTAADRLIGNYSKVIIAEGHGEDHPNAFGLAVYFPHSKKYNQFASWQKEYDNLIDFSAESWSKFLHIFNDPLVIDHERLKDTEDTTRPYRIKADVSGYMLNDNQVGVYYSYDRINFQYLNLNRSGGINEFSVELPAQKDGTDVYYYLEANDQMGNQVHLPENAPELALKDLFSFYIGRDYINPIILHTPISDKIYSKNEFEITATVTDNIGVNESRVKLFYKVDDDKNYIELTATPHPSMANAFRAYIPPQLIGSVIYYHFEATDTAKFPNKEVLPLSGDYDFRILGIIINIGRDKFHVNSDADYGNFYDTLVAPGYNMTLVDEQLSKTTLEDIDLYVIAEPTKYFTTTEISNLRNYLNNGGDLLIISGDNSSIMTGLTGFLGMNWQAHSEELGYTNTFANIPSIFNDINELYYTRPMLKVSTEKPTMPLLENDLQEATLAAYSYHGQGKIVAITQGFFAGDSIEESYNTQFLNNLGLWMVKCPIAVPDGEETKVNGEIVNDAIDNIIEIDEDGFVGFDGNSSVYPEWLETDLNYTWDLGDGTTDYGPRPAHKYCYKGTFNVSLTVRTYDGYFDSGYITIIVDNIAPQSYPGYSRIDDMTVYFNASASIDTETDLSTLTYDWDFGDGSSGTGMSPEHTYRYKDRFTVTLTVTDNDGEYSVSTLVIDLGKEEESGIGAYLLSIGSIILIIVFIIIYAVMQKNAKVKEEQKEQEEMEKQSKNNKPRMVRRVVKKP
jgi:chitodextrinase